MTHTITDLTPEDRRRIDDFLAPAAQASAGRTDPPQPNAAAPAPPPAADQSAAARP